VAGHIRCEKQDQVGDVFGLTETALGYVGDVAAHDIIEVGVTVPRPEHRPAGQTALTVMFSSACSSARALVKLVTAPLEVT
jgi:hypothetical protein